MSDSIFIHDGDGFAATEHARGPWDPNALHGGAVAALIASAFERVQPGAEMPIARLDFQLLRPIPFQGLSLDVSVARAGRRHGVGGNPVNEASARLRHAGRVEDRGDRLQARGVDATIRRAVPIRSSVMCVSVTFAPAAAFKASPHQQTGAGLKFFFWRQ